MRLASVVITNYNYGQFVGRAIASALAQTYPTVEVIVVDDGSTDDSRTVIARYRDSIRPILKENGGQGSAFNAGISAAQGDVIYFLDADDEYTPDVVGTSIGMFETGVARVHWPYQRIDARGTPLGAPVSAQVLTAGDIRERVIRHGPGTHRFAPTSAMAADRAALFQLPALPEDAFVTGADTYIAELTPFVGRLAVAPDALTLYRRHADNDSDHGTFATRLARWAAWYDACARLAEQYCSSRGVAVVRKEWERHGWAPRLRRAVIEIKRRVPAGMPYLLIDDDEWSLSNDPFSTAIPFPQREGVYWGPPPDDAQCIAELAGMWASGVRYVVLAWTSFWWRDHYREAFVWLNARATTVEVDDLLVVFAMRDEIDVDADAQAEAEAVT